MKRTGAQAIWEALVSEGIETVFGWVVGVDKIKPIEIMGREVIPAAAELVAAGTGPAAEREIQDATHGEIGKTSVTTGA